MPPPAPKLHIIAGEASGDARGAELLRALRERVPDLQITGAGGREMAALANGPFLDWADEGVVGLWEVIKKYGYFKKQLVAFRDEVVRTAPDAVLFIDYPGFNLRLAKSLKRLNSRVRRLFYVSPQVWAWNRGRIREMGGYLDLMLCIFPFEQPLYEASGLHALFVGHPMLDTLDAKRLHAAREPQLVGIFPGSRKKEVRRIFPPMIAAARKMQQQQPALHFEAAAASEELAAMMREIVAAAGLDPALCTIRTGGGYHELMQRAAAGMVCSGTATLEAAFFGLPLCVVYKVAWLTWVIAKRLVRVPFLGMPNVLAGREIAREFLQSDATPENLAQEMLRLLNSDAARASIQRDLAQVIAGLGARGAAGRAADAIIATLGWKTA